LFLTVPGFDPVGPPRFPAWEPPSHPSVGASEPLKILRWCLSPHFDSAYRYPGDCWASFFLSLLQPPMVRPLFAFFLSCDVPPSPPFSGIRACCAGLILNQLASLTCSFLLFFISPFCWDEILRWTDFSPPQFPFFYGFSFFFFSLWKLFFLLFRWNSFFKSLSTDFQRSFSSLSPPSF